MFLEFGHSAALSFIVKIKIIAIEKSFEEGDYDKELDLEGSTQVTFSDFFSKLSTY